MKYFFYSIVLLVIGPTVYFTLSSEDHTIYIQEITEQREIKDNNFRSDKDSPIKEDERSKFTGLNYFEVDPEFKVQAKIEKNTRMEQVSLGSSTGNYLNYLVFGYAVFKIDGNTHKLMLLQETGPGSSPRLFLPFSDQTSANQTYGGGRYLDLDYDLRSNRITLDFNQAYFPYCAYNELYTCAIPPPENHLSISILAGEKN